MPLCNLARCISIFSTSLIPMILTSAVSTQGRQLSCQSNSYAQLRDFETMRAIAYAHQTHDMDVEQMRDYCKELSSATTIRSHFATNILCIVDLYSTIKIIECDAQQDIEAMYTTPLPLASALFGADFPQYWEPLAVSNFTRRNCQRVRLSRYSKWPSPIQRARSRRGRRSPTLVRPRRLSLSRPTRSKCPLATQRAGGRRNHRVACEREGYGDGLERVSLGR